MTRGRRRRRAGPGKRWGRSLNLAFIAGDERDILKGKDVIYALLDKGHRVNIFSKDKGDLKILKDHMEIRFIKKSPIFPKTSVIFKIYERRKKKKIDIVIAADKKTQKIMRKFDYIHGARVMGLSRDPLLGLCEEMSKWGVRE